jgi:hypothetical protein
MIDEDSGASEMAEKILTFVNGVGITDEFLPGETRLLNAPFGTLTDFERVETSWLVEGMLVLAWAIGKAELPKFGTKCNAASVSIGLGMFRPGTKERLTQAVLRDPGEIEAAALSYLALNWRIGKFIADPREKLDFVASLKDPNSPHLVVDGVELVDGDMAIDGLPLPKVKRDRFGEVFTIVRQRFNAFKWLQGYATQYAADTTVH